VNNSLKAFGFRRLSGQGWFRQVFFTDERLCGRALARTPGAPFFPLADPPTQVFDHPSKAARTKLALPEDKRIFLFYGGPYWRKGLHLAVRAMLELPPDHPSLILCVGRQSPESEIAAGLAQLAQQGRALVINRYVTPEEEKNAFSACDIVLLPYIGHFGSSGVMAQAAAAAKSMIASDENLVGARVRDYRLGWLFPSGDATRLRQVIDEAARAAPERLAEFASGAVAYSRVFSRAAFRRSLLASFGCEAA
jgi:glycosyltransferase involved in cell wall biosynthesis